MAESKSSIDPVAVLERVGVEIKTARKTVRMLYEQLGMTNDTAKEIARMFLLTLFDNGESSALDIWNHGGAKVKRIF